MSDDMQFVKYVEQGREVVARQDKAVDELIVLAGQVDRAYSKPSRLEEWATAIGLATTTAYSYRNIAHVVEIAHVCNLPIMPPSVARAFSPSLNKVRREMSKKYIGRKGKDDEPDKVEAAVRKTLETEFARALKATQKNNPAAVVPTVESVSALRPKQEKTEAEQSENEPEPVHQPGPPGISTVMTAKSKIETGALEAALTEIRGIKDPVERISTIDELTEALRIERIQAELESKVMEAEAVAAEGV